MVSNITKWESILSITWTSVFRIKVIIVLCTWNHTVMRHITFSYSQWGGKEAHKMEITPTMTLLGFYIWLAEPVAIHQETDMAALSYYQAAQSHVSKHAIMEHMAEAY